VSWGYALMRHFHRHSSGVMVPTQSVLNMLEQRGFRNLRSWTHGVDTSLFEFRHAVQPYPPLGEVARPVSLFVGRVSYEKNIEAFLDTELPGTKVVCGVGPVEARLKEKYPQVRWLGLLPRHELAKVYAAADVFVFPSHADTFGLVMVEAMASGTPVAAFPVDGPLEVLARSHPDGRTMGGAMNRDLKRAVHDALTVPRHDARARAQDFSWAHASRLFANFLVPARS
jgi:glycosyltransferase involved in cell wall biosynthesis